MFSWRKQSWAAEERPPQPNYYEAIGTP